MLAVVRLIRSACLLTLRLTLHFGITTAVLFLIVFVALGADKDDLAALDPRPHLQAAFRFDADQGGSLLNFEQQMMDFSSTAPASLTDGGAEDDITTTNLVNTISRLLPTGQRSAYESLTPILDEYDAMLSDVQSAIARRSVDTMFGALQPWLDMAEKDAARYQAPYTD